MRTWRVLGIALCAGLMACGGRETGVRFPGATTGLLRPQRLDSLATVIRQLNAIVLADVRDISTDYDRCEGPRTVLHLAGVKVLLGGAHPDTMQLRLFGGSLPNNRYVEMSESPRYMLGRRYVLFLFNRDWRFSPVISDHAFRVEPIAGREVLVAPNGKAVTGVSDRAVETETRMLFVPEGLPGIGTVSMSPTPVVAFTPCGVNPDGTPNCPRLPASSPVSNEFFPVPEPWTPKPPTREDVASTLGIDDLVRRIDAAARAIGVTPGGYFASRPRLECWDASPTREPAK
jgi:hypothetical protein